MRKLLRIHYIFLSLLPLTCLCQTNDCGGEYRWDYKILVDPTGWPLLHNKPSPQSISQLVHLSRPETLGNQRTSYEKRKVKVIAWLTMLGKEDDNDYHLVITSDNRKDSMITEIPDGSCDKVRKFPELSKDYTAARQFIDENIKQPSSEIKKLNKPVKVIITGFVFFDKIAHGKGHAPNGIEIHPVISITKAS
jgi:hypothetical protein